MSESSYFLPEPATQNLLDSAAGNEMEKNQLRASASRSHRGDVGQILLRRVPIVICAVVALDWLLLGSLFYWLGWRIPLVETILMSVVGLLVIVYYEWRWSGMVAKRLESEPGLIDGWSVEKMLLLLAGFVFLIPGVGTDCLAMLMLMPGVRRAIVKLLHLCL
jgi:UPF0716 family protein affecting phage T7 exclusion